MSNFSKIKTSTCDDCGRKGPGVERTHSGHAVTFVCRHCEPVEFEKKARIDIDRWLTGS